ncbi:MAG: MBL fold metallo-hydrolase [Clostridiales bacterium]|nr:MBL fold metallo-hydrolase [Clostridiales bacterium]
MDFTTLASGSTGNCYIVSSGNSKLMLECGIPIKKIKAGCGYRLHQMAACLITHEHQDHCKAAQDILAAGIDIYCSQGTAQACGISGYRVHIIKAREQFNIGPWAILPFEVQHDAAEPLGFLISDGSEKLLFATDTYYLRHTFTGLTKIALECNYALDTLDANIVSGYVEESRRSRLLASHMSLEQCKKTLAANDLSQVRQIYLLHLSAQNADAERFKREVQRLTGREVYIAG